MIIDKKDLEMVKEFKEKHNFTSGYECLSFLLDELVRQCGIEQK